MKLDVGKVYSVRGQDCCGWEVTFTAQCVAFEAEDGWSLIKATFANGVTISGQVPENGFIREMGTLVKDDGKTARWTISEVAGAEA